MLTPRSARALRHLPRAPGLSSMVTVNSFACGISLGSVRLSPGIDGWRQSSRARRDNSKAAERRGVGSFGGSADAPVRVLRRKVHKTSHRQECLCYRKNPALKTKLATTRKSLRAPDGRRRGTLSYTRPARRLRERATK